VQVNSTSMNMTEKTAENETDPINQEVSRMADGAPTRLISSPFDIKIETLDRMLNFEIADDPIYSGLEIQGFDDDEHGRGMLVFLQRRDSEKTDVYYEAGLKLNPKLYAVGGGLGVWKECRFDKVQLDISEISGVYAEAIFRDIDGRLIQVHVEDSTPLKGRMAHNFLAPVGAAISKPQSLMLVNMTDFDLMRRAGPEPEILIDGKSASPGSLPAETCLGRRLIKIAKDLCIVTMNPIDTGERVKMMSEETIQTEAEGINTITKALEGHKASLCFDPPFPNVSTLFGNEVSGKWRIEIDDLPSVVSGHWSIAPTNEGSDVKVKMEVNTGWRPKGLPLLMKFVTTIVPVFRNWPETYQWVATVHHGDLTMHAQWERTTSDRGESYQAMSGTKKRGKEMNPKK